MNTLKALPLMLVLPLLCTACKPGADGAQPAAAVEAADIVILDAAVYTVNPAMPWAEAVAIRDGTIIFVGTAAEAEALTGPGTRVISQPGGMVLPGFQDAHLHPLTSGIDQFDCNLETVAQTEQAYVEAVADCARRMPERAWISGGGWSVTAFPPAGIPGKAALDAAVPGRPAVLFSIDGHTAWANSLALEAAGITAATRDPTNGRIDRDRHTGEPVGSLQEAAMDLVRAHLPPPPPKQITDGMRYTLDYLHGLGITAMQEASASINPDDPQRMLPTYRAFADSGKLDMHTSISLRWDSSKGLEQIHALEQARERYDGGMLRVSTVKFFLDGVVEPSTAALLEDYADQPGYRGELQVPPELLNEAVARLDELGFQVHIHVIGDAAVRAALDAFEHARERNGTTDNRHHLAHVEFVDPGDIGRFAELNVTATFSPLWAIEDEYLTELTLPRVGPERYRWTYPIGSILTAQGRIAFGSDWNVSSPDPLLAIETAVTRVEPLEHATPVFMPQERITLADAIAAATANAAYVNHIDDRTGTIEAGKRADLVVLDTNLFEIEPPAISDAKVVMTLFGGEAVYTRAPQGWSQDANDAVRSGPERTRMVFDKLSGRAAGTVVYRNVALIDGTGAAARDAVSIVVAGERIDAILPKDARLPDEARVVDGSGWYAIPGLIDSHVHLATMPASDIARQHLRRQVYSGITAVRDMAGDTRNLADLARAALINETEAPDIYYSALMAGPSFFTDPRPMTSALGIGPGRVPWMQAITGQTDLVLAVAEAKGTGASGIKLYADLPGERVRGIIAEAKRQGIPVWTHQRIFPADPFDPVEGGAVSVSHACMIASYAVQPDKQHYGSDDPPDYSQASVEDPVVQRYFSALIRHGTILDATLSIFPEEVGASPPPFLCPMRLAAALTRAAHEAGVRIAAGTDSLADADDPFPPLFGEIGLLVSRAGLSPMEALQAASFHGAAILGREASMGTLEAGKLANIVFLAEDPQADVAALRSVVLTLKRGVAFHRSDYRHEAIPRIPFPEM